MNLTEPLCESLSSMGSLQYLTICVAFHLPWETNAADSGPNPAVAGAWDPEKLRKIIAL